MRALMLEGPGILRPIEMDEPGPPAAGQALVEVRRVGICGTDLHAYAGRQPFFDYPRIVGHELGVAVLGLGPQTAGPPPGSACAVEPYLPCGSCIACRRGHTNCCESLQVLGVHRDGGLRERLLVPASHLHAGEGLSFDELALVETLAVGAHAVARATPAPGEGALVIGAGPIGLAVIAALRAEGIQPLVLEAHAGRREFCRQALGIETPLEPAEDLPARLRERLGGDLPTLVFDATGSLGSMAAAFGYVANSGRLTLVGLARGQVCFEDPEFHRRELTLLASRNATAADMRRCIEALQDGRIDLRPWISARIPMGEAAERLPALLQPDAGVIKAIIEVS